MFGPDLLRSIVAGLAAVFAVIITIFAETHLIIRLAQQTIAFTMTLLFILVTGSTDEHRQITSFIQTVRLFFSTPLASGMKCWPVLLSSATQAVRF
jgi:hypothetical protein